MKIIVANCRDLRGEKSQKRKERDFFFIFFWYYIDVQKFGGKESQCRFWSKMAAAMHAF